MVPVSDNACNQPPTVSLLQWRCSSLWEADWLCKGGNPKTFKKASRTAKRELIRVPCPTNIRVANL